MVNNYGMLELSIIIVNYNAEDLLLNCIKSIYECENSITFEIIVIDNNSKDNSRKSICAKFSQIKWIQNDTNLGFAAANNQGIEASQGKYCMLLNNDTLISDYALERLVKFIDNDETIGAVGPRILNTDGSLQLSCRRGLPNLMNSVGYFSKIYKVFPNNKALGSYTMSYISDSISHQVEALSGAAMVIRKEILCKLNGLDENFFMHFEDIDLCLRIGNLGYKLFYVHNSKIVHLKGQSSKLRSKKVIEDYNASLKYYYKKNYEKKKSFLSNILVYIFIWLRKILSITVYNIKQL